MGWIRYFDCCCGGENFCVWLVLCYGDVWRVEREEKRGRVYFREGCVVVGV